MIQDIAPQIFYNEYTPEPPAWEDPVFVFRDREVLLGRREDGALCCPDAGQFPEEDLQFLFRIDEKKYYLYRKDFPEDYGWEESGSEETGSEDLPEEETRQKEMGFDVSRFDVSDDEESLFEWLWNLGYDRCTTRIFRSTDPKDLCFAGMTAWHLYAWYKESAFCGRCGHPAIHDERERMMRCPVCGQRNYPRIAPAVIVGVTHGDRIMMTRYAGRSYKGHALIAGFCEIGESVEETVRREVMEEVGLHVKNIRYYKSQPWGFAFNLLMGFYCEVDGDTRVTMDEEELSVAKWVHAREIGQEESNLSLTADMIVHFKECRLREWAEETLPASDGKKGKDSETKTLHREQRTFSDGKKAEEETPGDPVLSRIRRIWEKRIPGLSVRRKGVSAVILPLVRRDDCWQILFEKRASSLVWQPGEICFPGGRVEEGESFREAAIRETMEELLVRDDQIEVIADLDPVMGPSGASIWPFAAVLHNYEGSFSKDEVAEVFTIPLQWFLDHEPERHITELATVPGEDFPYELIPGGRNYPWRRKRNAIVFYRTKGGILWGITARMTYDFIHIYKGE